MLRTSPVSTITTGSWNRDRCSPERMRLVMRLRRRGAWILEVKLPTIWTDGKAQTGRKSEESRCKCVAAGAETPGKMRDQKVQGAVLWREAHLEVKSVQNSPPRNTLRCRKLRVPDHFLKFGCNYITTTTTRTITTTLTRRWRKFQDRKHIGEVGCCVAWMVERSH